MDARRQAEVGVTLSHDRNQPTDRQTNEASQEKATQKVLQATYSVKSLEGREEVIAEGKRLLVAASDFTLFAISTHHSNIEPPSVCAECQLALSCRKMQSWDFYAQILRLS